VAEKQKEVKPAGQVEYVSEPDYCVNPLICIVAED
jgi:hypothetical protein